MSQQKVHVYTELGRIEREKEALEDNVSFLQELLNAFAAIGIDVTLHEMIEQTQLARQNIKYLNEFVSEKLMDKIGTANFNGVPIQRVKLKEMLELPNLNKLEKVLEDYIHNAAPGSGLVQHLFSLEDGVVSKAADADKKITEACTHYTTTERGAKMATKLKAVCDALNQWDEEFPRESHAIDWGLHGLEADGAIPGIIYRNQHFMPNMDFIRRRE